MKRWNTLLPAVALVLVGLLTVFFAFRGTQHARRLHARTDEPIQAWMTVPYIAHAYHVQPQVIAGALGLPPEQRDRRPLQQIAEAQGRTPDALIADIKAAITKARTSQPAPNGPRPAPPSEQQGAPPR